VIWLERQLDRIVTRAPDHLVITGDLLDRWLPAVLERVLDALGSRGLLASERLTLLHGNHDLASSGGHPRRGADLWRLAGRFWDPPPIVAARRRQFHSAIARRGAGIASAAPWRKALRHDGATIAILDTVPAFWAPVTLQGRTLVVRHAVGCIPRSQTAWLATLRGSRGPLVVLMHHYPLESPPFRWTPDRIHHPAMEALRWLHAVEVRMEIDDPDRRRFWRAAVAAGVRLVLCGHVHRTRLERRGAIDVGLNGQSGAAWAGRTIAWYQIGEAGVGMETEKT
jgi:hypothetical protein